MHRTRVSRHLAAPRAAVYRMLLDPEAVARWRVPDGMSARVHAFDAREGGLFRVSLTYEGPGTGKSGARTDTYHGRFARLVPDERIVEVLEFETPDPALRGAMTLTTTLADAPGGGTDVTVDHEGLPDAVPAADNETGTRMALGRLAALLDGEEPADHPA
ncbi:SRPBCC family protein [Streptomyces tagetis]|uniref:SRPBCC family protein n=1 Tax=Streptomyces tagetis TaxID=2820809 RepID=A0A940XLL2_9ACTN|nr:SRPBCC family protein [Streptomyces sp. RG38]MBQ0826814.1 SRPBCC family protein [Streptomyces sp. RG38]